MVDFEALIAAAVKEGTSEEELAAQFAAALNKSKAPEKKKPATREDIIQGVMDILDKHLENEQLDLSDAGALVWLCAVKDTDVGKAMTSPEELMAFLEFITEDLAHTTEKWQAQKVLSKIFHLDEFPNKREEKKAAAGSDRISKGDSDTIANFLRGMGLLR